MLVISRIDTKNRIVKNAQNAFIGCCEINFFSFQKIFQYLVPFFQNLTKKTRLPFVTLLEIPCISQVFLLSKNVFKNGLYSLAKCIYLKSSLSAPCLVSPMLLNVYLNKSKKRKEKLRNNRKNKTRKKVKLYIGLIISSSELRERVSYN